jgi:hypothetical protein
MPPVQTARPVASNSFRKTCAKISALVVAVSVSNAGVLHQAQGSAPIAGSLRCRLDSIGPALML